MERRRIVLGIVHLYIDFEEPAQLQTLSMQSRAMREYVSGAGTHRYE